MRLYLARHGEADHRAPDELRELTARGRAETERVFSAAAPRLEQSIASVAVSPLVRAQQTAEVALARLPCAAAGYTITEQLRPSASIPGLAPLVEQHAGHPLLLVGHQPLLGRLLAWLCDDESLSAIATSSLHAVDLIGYARGGASLLWSLQP